MDIALLSLFLLLGVIFLILEIFLLPGFGIGGVAGIGFIGVAIWYAFTYVGVTAVWVTSGASILLLILGIWLFLRFKVLDKISLKAEIDGTADNKVSQIKEGDTGIARTRLAPMGNARFGDLDVEVKSEDGYIDAGTPIVVSQVNSTNVCVRLIK